jgi:hypothetical protein
METHQPIESAVCDSAFCSCFVPYSIFHGCGVSFFYPEVMWDNIGRQPAGLCAQMIPKARTRCLSHFPARTICPGQKIAFTRLNSFPIIRHAFACAGDFFVQRGRII